MPRAQVSTVAGAFACAAIALAAGCGGCRHGAGETGRGGDENKAARGEQAAEKVVTLVVTSEIRGTPEPCGCQSDPLGDVARVATLLAEAQKANAPRGGALLVDAGGLRYKEEAVKPEQRNQAELKADFLEDAWRGLSAEVGLGDEDFAFGADRLPKDARTCENVRGLPLRPARVRTVGDVKVGVFAVMDPEKARAAFALAKDPRLSVTDPTEAARAAVASLRGQGAEVVVAAAHLGRSAARKLARDVPGISVVVAGDDCGDDGADPEQVGDTLLVQPADQAQKVVRVELHVTGGRVSARLFADAAMREKEVARLDRKLDQVGRELLKLRADPAADPSFVKTKEAEQARLRDERQRTASASPVPPPGPYALAQLVPVRRRVPRDPKIADAMKQLDARVGESNRAAAANIPPPPAAPGEPHYVGMDDCESCHAKAVAFWKGTVHARAWKELVDVNKQWSYDCISCHVTGYGRAGGTSMAHVDDLMDVQCEVCHGPGSAHSDEPKKVKLPNPVENDCLGCHTREHSDTFQYEPYLRDVVGPGHGEKLRAKLGPGPTGHELRHGAKQRAEEK